MDNECDSNPIVDPDRDPIHCTSAVISIGAGMPLPQKDTAEKVCLLPTIKPN